MTMPIHIRPRTLLLALLCSGALLFACTSLLAGSSSYAAGAKKPGAHAASSYLTGIGDQQTEMFTNPLWTQLHTKIARYIAPYDAAVRPYSLQLARAWITAAEADHQQVLVAFYHSEYTPTKMPSVAVYQRDVQKFIKLFPHVRQYQPWNEANRGTIVEIVKGKRHIALVSPSAMQSAQYYRALKLVCKGCTIVGLDALDAPVVTPTLEYIAQFKHDIARLKTVMPSIWGLHNYSDTNRYSSSRTRAILAAVPGQVWLTETGGIVQFGSDFPNKKGSGLTRAAKALSYMFKIAGSSSRIKRLYIYDWTGGYASTRFDAGLMNAKYEPRPGYVVVCKQLHAANCNVKVAKN
ncbi:MAG TPA: hypothetical protein VGP18_12680 [Solirubrobacteraceae bacterium]|jgi:hypothetical protein|nr:hypothetical protein [Solirubrobacteraceae bacterium]